MKLFHSFLYTICLALPMLATAQEQKPEGPWSLEQCINYAKENNLTLKQQVLNAQYNQNLYNQKRFDLLPTLNASSSYNISMGRVRDNTTFQISNVTTQISDYGISSSTPLFEGFTLRNTIQKGRLDWMAAVKDAKKTENDLALNIAALYMQILFDKELLLAAKAQLEVANMQVERTAILVKNNQLPEGNLLEVQSIAASETYNVTTLENNLSLSLLDLAQALDLEDVTNFDIQRPEIGELTGMEMADVNSIYGQAVATLPQIASSELQLESSLKDIKIAKGALLPQLSFNAGWGSDVSKMKNQENFDFTQSFKDNSYEYVGLSLSIPIFNGLSARQNVANAKIGYLSAQHELEKEKQVLRKDVQKAYTDAQAAFRQYLAGKATVESYKKSFSYTERRFNLGLINTVDYNVAKTDFIKAESDLIQARYTYLLRLKILDFYQGKPLATDTFQ
jgi:outer membrane protein